VPQAAKDALSSTVAAVPQVLGQAQQKGLPAPAAQSIQNSAFDAFIQASHVTTWISVALILLAAGIVALRLPKSIHHGGAAAPVPAGESPVPAPVAGE